MSEKPHLSLGIFGSADFCRRVAAIARTPGLALQTSPGSLSEAWGIYLTHRPQLVALEIGLGYSERQHGVTLSFLQQLRERFGEKAYIIVCLAAPEKLFFGGDLLLTELSEGVSAGLVDTFVASPPATLASVPSVAEQTLQALTLGVQEMSRRATGKVPLPPLGSPGWVQSLADPKSRDLWMCWLPRYATYTNENPIIIGETGTGKTNLAYALHLLSGRKGQFVSITPRDFSSSELVQAELFGAVAGAYTGAVDKWGLVKSAEKGTLFIDELQSIDKDLQGKLITFIENKTYRRVGSAESVSADVRFVFASNRTLEDMMASDVLRHDFAYRLERVQLELAPLYKRRLDIAPALAYALAKVRRQRPRAFPVFGFTSAAYRMLFAHNWPGNLRQLENIVARLCELADMKEAPVIDEGIVSQVFESRLQGIAASAGDVFAQACAALAPRLRHEQRLTLSSCMSRITDTIRGLAMEACGGDLSRAAQILGDDPALLELVNQAGASKRDVELSKG